MFAQPSKEPPKEAWDAHLYKEDDQVISFHGEFLFWKTVAGGLDYALKTNGNAWGPANTYALGTFENSTYNIEPGFRVSASFFRAPKSWEVWGSYTRLTASGEDSAHKPSVLNQYLTGTWAQIVPNPLAEASTYIHLNYNVADMYVDRYFLPNPHLRLRLIGGITGVWMDQFWSIRYRDAVNNHTHITNRWKFGGAGLRFGTMVDWFWTHNIYFTAKGTVAVCIGSYHNQSRQMTNYAPSINYNTSLPIRNASYRDTRPTTSLQVLVGPSYQKNFKSARMEFFVGYELTGWINLQEIYRSGAGAPGDAKETFINSSMLAFQGLTTRVTVDF